MRIIALFITMLVTLPSVANISVSSYRIYLDREKNSTDFWVTNKELAPIDCQVKFGHYKFDESGNVLKYNDPNIMPEHSAIPLLRYSPKTFVISPKSKQKIRFSMRNKRGVEIKEYRTHVVLSCIPQISDDNSVTNSEFAAVKVKPILQPNVPLIVRPNKLEGNVEIKNINYESRKLVFDMSKTGTRSVYGLINVKDDRGNLISSSRKFPIYHETTNKNLSLSLPPFESSTLTVEFVEDSDLSGTLLVSKTVNVN